MTNSSSPLPFSCFMLESNVRCWLTEMSHIENKLTIKCNGIKRLLLIHGMMEGSITLLKYTEVRSIFKRIGRKVLDIFI